jgi:hypothetical protein
VVPEELQLVQLASATGRPIGGREGSPARGPGQAYRWRYDFLIIKVRFEEKYLRASPPQRSEQQAAVRCASWHAYINVTQCRDRWIRGRVTWKKQYPDAAQPQRNARDTAEKVERQVAETGHVRDHARASVRAGCGETSSPGGLLTWAAALGFRPCRCLILHLLPLSASVGFRLLVLYAREVFRRWCHQDDGRHAAALFCLSQLLKA